MVFNFTFYILMDNLIFIDCFSAAWLRPLSLSSYTDYNYRQFSGPGAATSTTGAPTALCYNQMYVGVFYGCMFLLMLTPVGPV